MEFGRKGTEQGGSSSSVTGGSSRPAGEVATTTLGEDTEFSGTLNFGNSLRIEGKFQGDLTSPGHLIVGGPGQVRAEVNVGSLTVEGKLTGNIKAKDLVDLRKSAEVFGDINASKIKIEEGVVFVGKAQIKPKDSKSQPLSKESKDLAPGKPSVPEKGPATAENKGSASVKAAS